MKGLPYVMCFFAIMNDIGLKMINFKKILFLFLLLLVELPIQAQNLRRRLDELVADPMFETSQLGMMVWDLTDDALLYEYNARHAMRPASTMKLLTAITALDRLGANYRMGTSLYCQGNVDQHTLRGDLILVGEMDPLFDTLGLRMFVDSLQRMGIDTICGNIVTDCSFKDTLMWGEGWCWDDKNPTLSPLLLNGKDDVTEWFVTKLTNAGLCLDSIGFTTGRPSDTARLVCRCEHGIDQMLPQMMKESDNFYAECLYYQIAASYGKKPASAVHAQTLEKQLMSRLGLKGNNYRLADGSGLSLYNYLSAEIVTRLLRYAWRTDSIRETLLQALPIAGEEGTLAYRMTNTAAAGNVRAKTGTLTGVTSLAGYLITANDHVLCFCIFVQGVMKASEGRAFQDRVCAALCEP